MIIGAEHATDAAGFLHKPDIDDAAGRFLTVPEGSLAAGFSSLLEMLTCIPTSWELPEFSRQS